ncbi:MAG: hypothetical protein EOO28_11840 [Comamonadaceae bacterium]|nr:MAG: hypothetical protein EOO28_11840 [Comamonadaceae bacterium]
MSMSDPLPNEPWPFPKSGDPHVARAAPKVTQALPSAPLREYKPGASVEADIAAGQLASDRAKSKAVDAAIEKKRVKKKEG